MVVQLDGRECRWRREERGGGGGAGDCVWVTRSRPEHYWRLQICPAAGTGSCGDGGDALFECTLKKMKTLWKVLLWRE